MQLSSICLFSFIELSSSNRSLGKYRIHATMSKINKLRRVLLGGVRKFFKEIFGSLDVEDGELFDTKIYTLRQQQEIINQSNDMKNASLWMFNNIKETIKSINNLSATVRSQINDYNGHYLLRDQLIGKIHKKLR